jgi:hypothetical protein
LPNQKTTSISQILRKNFKFDRTSWRGRWSFFERNVSFDERSDWVFLLGFPVIGNGAKLGTAGRYARKQDLNRFLQAIRVIEANAEESDIFQAKLKPLFLL